MQAAQHGIVRGHAYMTSDGMGGGGVSEKSDFIVKGVLTNHLMTGEGGLKKAENHLTSYVHGP